MINNVFFSVIFDNGGGVTLQTDDGFVHSYDDARHAAADVKILLDGGNTSIWDGNEIDEFGTQVYDADVERNGGYQWLDRYDVESIVTDKILDTSWRNMRDFFYAFGVDTDF